MPSLVSLMILIGVRMLFAPLLQRWEGFWTQDEQSTMKCWHLQVIVTVLKALIRWDLALQFCNFREKKAVI
jgi:hypothetical protein